MAPLRYDLNLRTSRVEILELRALLASGALLPASLGDAIPAQAPSDDEKFVSEAYHDLLNRAADPGGLAYWVAQLNSGLRKNQIADALAHSAEYYSTIIDLAYANYLGRSADNGGRDFWISQMRSGLTDEQIESGFTSSAEFYALADNSGVKFVDALYVDLLGRSADPQGEGFWTRQLDSGVARADVAYGLAASLEHEQQRVEADYLHYLGRVADQQELSFWVSQFAQGSTNEDIITGFVSSSEYYAHAANSSIALSAQLAVDTGNSNSDGITNDPTVSGQVVDTTPITNFEAVRYQAASTSGGATHQYIILSSYDLSSDLAADGSFTLGPGELARIFNSLQVSPGAEHLSDGLHTLSLQAGDAAGNKSTILDVPFTLDTQPPRITIASPANNLITTDNVSLAGQVSDAVSGVAGLEAIVDGGAPAKVAFDSSGNFHYATQLATDGTADGDHVVRLTATDLAGNVSASINFRFTLQSVKPVISITNPAGLTTNQNFAVNGQVTGLGSAPFTLKAAIDGGAYSAITLDSTGKFTAPASLALDGSADGEHTIRLKLLKSDGSTAATADYSFTLDTQSPLVTTTSPASNLFTGLNITLSGQAIDAASGVASVQAAIDGGAYSMLTLDGQGRFSLPTTLPLDGTADGAHVVYLKAFDKAGNASAVADYHFTLDTRNPVINVSRSAAGEAVNQNITVSGIVTDSQSDLSSLQVAVDDGAYGGLAFDASSQFSFTTALALNGTADGSHVLHFTAADKAGNTSVATDFPFLLDTAPPTVTISNPASGLTTNGNITIGGSVGDSLSGVAGLEASIDGGAFADVAVDAQGNFSLTTQLALNGSADGPHSVQFQATDKAGNICNPTNFAFTLDTTSPAISLTGPAAGQTVNHNMVIVGQAADGGSGLASVMAAVDGGPFSNIVVDSAGNFSLTTSLAVDGTADGAHTVHFEAIDKAGNASPVADFTMTLLTIPPTISSFDLSLGSQSGPVDSHTTDAARVTLVGQTSPGAKVTLAGTSLTALASGSGAFQFPDVELAEGDNSFTAQATDAAGNTAALPLTVHRTTASGRADPVITWNENLLAAIRLNASDPLTGSRAMAMVQSAVYDAVNAVENKPGRFVTLATPAGAAAVAAIDQAAHDMLAYLFPAQKDAFDAELATSLSAIADDESRADGLAAGRQVAAAIIALRANDGWNNYVNYAAGTGPGVWQPTAPMFAEALDPQWATLTPWTMTSDSQFRPAGPPDLTSQAWADAVNQVETLGSAANAANADSNVQSDVQIARFWADNAGTATPPGHWNEIAEQVATSAGNSLDENARLFAELDVALADAAIVSWDAKYAYNSWRPITAIQNADSAGNPAVIQDPHWKPLLVTPNFPEYVSGHSTFSGTAAGILDAVFGADTGFTIGSDALAGVSRSFSGFDAAAEEAGISRIYAGIHFIFSDLDGLSAGHSLANHVLSTFDTAKDTVPPTITLSSPKQASASAQNVAVQGRVLDNLSGIASLSAAIDDGSLAPVTFDAQGNFTFTTDLPLDGSADGAHVVHFQAVDFAGNITPSADLTFTLDTLPPAITITAPSDGAALNAGDHLTGNADPTGSTLIALSYAIDSGAAMPMIFDPSVGAFDEPLDLSKLGPGAHTLVVSASDAAGNSATTTVGFHLDAPIPFTVSSFTPSDMASDVGVTFRPQVYFSRPIDPATLTARDFFATDSAGNILPASVVPASDGTFAWLLFTTPTPGASTITIHVDGSMIHAASDGALLDAADSGAPGSVLAWSYSTVSLAGIPGASLIGVLADPGADLKPGTGDDVAAGPDGVLMTGDDVYKRPIANVTLYILGMESETVTTDSQGRFELDNIPSGDVKLVVDGPTATNAPAGYYFPEMVMDLHILPGVANTVMAAMETDPTKAQSMITTGVYLPRLQTSLLQTVSSTAPTSVTVNAVSAPDLTDQQRQFLTLQVQPNSILGADGQPLANPTIGISTVSPDFVRDMLPPELRAQHQFEITIQAPGATVFTTPVQITFPNLQNAAPGTKVNVMSFDHTTGLVVVDGTGTVSADGLSITSDPGSGIRAPGWHFVQVGTQSTDGQICSNLCLVAHGRVGDIIEVDFPDTLLPKDSQGRVAGSRDWTFTPDPSNPGGLFFDINGKKITGTVPLGPNRAVYFLPNILHPSTSPNDPGVATDGNGTFSATLYDTSKPNDSGSAATGNLLVQVAQGWGNANVATNLSSSLSDELIAQVRQRLRYLGYQSPYGANARLIPMDGGLDGGLMQTIGVFNAAIESLNDPQAQPTPNATIDDWINSSNAPRWLHIPTHGANEATWTTRYGFNEWGTNWALNVINAASAMSQVPIQINFLSIRGGGPYDHHNTHEAGMDIDVQTDKGSGITGPWYDAAIAAGDFNSTSDLWQQISDASHGQPTPMDARTAIAHGFDSFTNSYEDNNGVNGWGLDQIIFTLYKHRGSQDAYDLAVQGWHTGGLRPGETPEVLFDRGFDLLVGTLSGYSHANTAAQISAFLNASTSGLTAIQINYNDPVVWRLLGNNPRLRLIPGHATHFHVDVGGSPNRQAAAGRSFGAQPFAAAPTEETMTSMSTSTGFGTNARVYYRFQMANGFQIAGQYQPQDQIRVMLAPDSDYTLTVYQPSTNSSGVFTGHTSASGTPTSLGTLVADDVGGVDSTGDGLPDIARYVIGLKIGVRSFAGDGIDDAVKLAEGLDPLDGRAFPTGIVASVSLGGSAQDVAVTGSTAYVADGTGGLAIVDVSQFNKPIVDDQLALPGTATGVAALPELNLVAVASGSAGLEIVNVANPLSPAIEETVNVPASRVKFIDGFAYVASGSAVVKIDPVTGDILQRLDSGGGAITDLAGNDAAVFTMDANFFLQAIDLSDGQMSLRGRLTMPVGGQKIFVGNGVVYAAASDFRNQGGFATADVSDLDNLKLLGFTPPADFRPGTSIAANGSGIALVAGTRVAGTPGATPRLSIMDARDPTQTDSMLFSLDLPSSPSAIAIASGIAFVADGSGGLQIINYLPFDNLEQPPTVSISTPKADVDPVTSGIQVVESSRVEFQAAASDDVQLRSVDLLINGSVVSTSVSYPWDLFANAPQFGAGNSSFVAQLRATDTGGNSTLSPPLSIDLVPSGLPPEIASVDPVDGGSRMEGAQSVRIRFADPLAPGTLTPDAIQLADSSGGIHPALHEALFDNGRQLDLIFQDLVAGDYLLTIHAAALADALGTPLGNADVVSHFTLTYRAVVSADPTDVDPNTPGTQIYEGTTVPVHVAVRGAAVQGIELLANGVVVGQATGTAADFSAIAPNLADGSGEVTIQARVTTSEGDTILSNMVTFGLVRDATPPSIVSIDPADGASMLEGTQLIKIQFTKPLAKPLVAGAIELLDSMGAVHAPDSEVFLDDDRLVELQFLNLLADDYSLVVHAPLITDRPGNLLGNADVTSHFTLTYRSTLATTVADLDPSTPGIQILEATEVPIHISVLPGTNVSYIDFYVNGVREASAGGLSADAILLAPILSSGASTATVQARVTDGNGFTTLSNPIVLDLLKDTTPPSVVSVAPPDSESLLEGSQQVTIQFSKPLAKPLNSNAFELDDSSGTAHQAVLEQLLGDDQQVELFYGNLLADDYRLILHAPLITDRPGNPLGTSDIASHFTLTYRAALITTVSDIDPNTPGIQVFEGTTIPVSVSVLPGVIVQNIDLVVNGNVAGSSATAPADFSVIAPNITDANTLLVQARITDVSGFTSLSPPIAISVLKATTPPRLLSTDPADGAVLNRPINSIALQFDKSIAKTATTAAFSLVEAGPDGTFGNADDAVEQITALQFTNDDTLLTLTTEPLGSGKYRLEIDQSAVTDRAGNPLGTGLLARNFTIQNVLFVTNSADSGPGSLRDAIEQANTASGAVDIAFLIPPTDPNFTRLEFFNGSSTAPLDVYIIQPQSPLPALNNPNGGITIDGRTQTAFGGDTNPFGPEIILDGLVLDSFGNSDGIDLKSDNNAVYGLDVVNFNSQFSNTAGIAISGSFNTVAGNYIGIDPTGAVAEGNGIGVAITDGSGNRIGARDIPNGAADRNVISGNQSFGVLIAPQDFAASFFDEYVDGNYIGTDVGGVKPVGNLNAGVSIDSDLLFFGQALQAEIGAPYDVSYFGYGVGNTIAFNGGAGVIVTGDAKNVRVQRNSIYGNSGPGIETPSNPVPTPSMTAAGFNGETWVSGSFNGTPLASYVLEFYASDAPDPQNVQGQRYLDSVTITTDDSGGATFTVPLIGTDIAGQFASADTSAGEFVTATAFDQTNGTTSQFSNAVIVHSFSSLEPNDTIAKAFNTGLSSAMPGTYTTNGTVGNNLGDQKQDVDMFLVQLNAGDRLQVSTDTSSDPGLDSYLRLFDSTGIELASNDNGPPPGGTIQTDSYLDFTAPSDGVYYIGLSGAGNEQYDPNMVDSGVAASTGAYDITFVVTNKS